MVHARRVIVCVNRTGCAWRYLPNDLPPRRTVYGYFARWRAHGTLQLLHDAHAFEVLPRRWVVERTLAWITAHRSPLTAHRSAPLRPRPPTGARRPRGHVLWAMVARITQHLATQRP